MLQILEESQGDLVALRLSAKVDKADYDVMLPLLQERIRQHGKIKVYAEVMGVEEYTLKALRDEVRFDLKHASDFSRVALVSDQPWLGTLANMARPFTTAEVRFFDFDARAAAWEWVHSS